MEQEANYKVNIDTADLQAQLANIRTMLDQTFQARMLTADIPNPQPQSFAFPSQGFDNALGIVSQDISGAQTGAGRALSSLNMGMQKFRESAIDALMSPGPNFGGPMPSDRYIPDFRRMGAYQAASAATFGFGYDPSMSMTRGAYKERASEQFGHEALGFGLDIGFGTAGMTLGRLAGSAAVGGIVGIVGGMIAKPVLDATLLYDYNTANEIKSYVRDTSWRFLSGKFSNEEASRIGVEFSTVQRSSSMVGDRIGASDVQRLLGEFTEAGAFDYVRSAEDYAKKAKDLIQNHRKVMQILRVSEQEAVAAWSQAGTIGAAAAIQGMAYGAGMTSSELMQWGNQGMEMVRGTGIDLISARQGAYQTIANVTDMVALGGISTALAQQLGGIQGISGYIQQAGYQWGMSSQGFTQLTSAGAFGGNFAAMANASPYETMAAAIGQNATIGDFLENKGGMAQTLSKMSPEVMYGMQGLQFLKEMQFQTGNGTLIGGLNENKFVGWMGQKYGMSDPQARLMWSTMTSQDDPRITVMAQRAEAAKNIIDATPGFIDYFLDTMGNAFGRMSESFTIPAASFANFISKQVDLNVKGFKQRVSGDVYGIDTNIGIKIMKGQKINKESLDEAIYATNKQREVGGSLWDSQKYEKSNKTNAETLKDNQLELGLTELTEKNKDQIDALFKMTDEERKNYGLSEEARMVFNNMKRGGSRGINSAIDDTRKELIKSEISVDTNKNILKATVNNLKYQRARAAEDMVYQNAFGVLKELGMGEQNMDRDEATSMVSELSLLRNKEMSDGERLKEVERVTGKTGNVAMDISNKLKNPNEGLNLKFTLTAAGALSKKSANNDAQNKIDELFDPNLASADQLKNIKDSANQILKTAGAADIFDLEGNIKKDSDPSKATLAVEMMNAQSLKQMATYFNAWAGGAPMPVYIKK